MIIAGHTNKLGSQNKFSKLVMIDPGYTKVSATFVEVRRLSTGACFCLAGLASCFGADGNSQPTGTRAEDQAVSGLGSSARQLKTLFTVLDIQDALSAGGVEDLVLAVSLPKAGMCFYDRIRILLCLLL